MVVVHTQWSVPLLSSTSFSRKSKNDHVDFVVVFFYLTKQLSVRVEHVTVVKNRTRERKRRAMMLPYLKVIFYVKQCELLMNPKCDSESESVILETISDLFECGNRIGFRWCWAGGRLVLVIWSLRVYCPFLIEQVITLYYIESTDVIVMMKKTNITSIEMLQSLVASVKRTRQAMRQTDF